jgi:predicted Zn-dependent protease
MNQRDMNRRQMNRREMGEQDRRDMSKLESPATRLRRPLARGLAMLTAAALAAAGIPAAAQQHGNGPPIIRDAEIEQLLREYSQPILKAAGLAQQNVRIVIINDPSFNAFVADGHRIFINSGALMQAKTPNEVIGVLSHESGHIAGGHLARMREQMANASTESLVAMLLGIGAMVAGARSGGSGVDFAARRPAEHHAFVYPRPGGAGGPRRREVPGGDRTVGQGHVRYVQALGR